MLTAFRDKKVEVTEALRGLSALSATVGARSLSERVERDVAQKLEAGRFHLVVVGEFNHGKTTFVNALLGAPILPVGVTPTTAAIHHIIHGDPPKATRVLEHGERDPVAFEDVASFTAQGDRASEKLKYLEVEYPASLLQEQLVLVDTPGVNDMSLTRAEITYGYIPQSDAVLFVLDAGQPVKESEREFIQKQLLAQSRDKIVFVVAKSDIWSEDERDEALAYIRDRLAELVEAPQLFPISAQAALSGDYGGSGLKELVEHLQHFLAEQRGRIVLENAIQDGRQALTMLGRSLDARRRAASMSLAELEKRIQLLERDLSGHADTVEKRRLNLREQAGSIKAWARRDLDRFCDDVVAQLPTALEKVSGDDVRQHLGAFLQHSFKDWATAETEEIASALEQLAERTVAMVREDADEASEKLRDAMGGDLQAPPVEVDTFAQDLGVFAVLSVGLGAVFANAMLGGVLLVAAPVLALYNRDRTQVLIRKRAMEVAPTALREAALKVAPKIDAWVDSFVERLDAWVQEASQEVYREVIEVLEDVKRQRSIAGPNAEGEQQACDTYESQRCELEGRFDQLYKDVTGELPGKQPQFQQGDEPDGAREDEASEGEASKVVPIDSAMRKGASEET